MVIFMTLLDRIKHLAQQNGTNIKGLESAANLGNGTIRRWNNSPPSADKLLKIANLLNTTMDYLMTGNEISENSFSFVFAFSGIHDISERDPESGKSHCFYRCLFCFSGLQYSAERRFDLWSLRFSRYGDSGRGGRHFDRSGC